jgi:peptidoglycan/LPS O-acetylase OafA/YrhL
LDALRFLAAFSVFIFHYFSDIKSFFPSLTNNAIFDKVQVVADKGSLGVNFFFVLSGFLITYLILHEQKHKGHFSLKKFLIRRTLRIWPLYFIVILIGFVLFPLIFSGYSTSHSLWMYVAFLANFDEINVGLHDSINFLTSPWSVAVEEQFYLFWGLLFFTILRLRKVNLGYIIVVLYLLSFLFRWYYVDEERIIYYHTFAVCQDILTGAFIGWSLFENKKWLEYLKHMRKIWVAAIYIIGFAICILKNKIFFGDLLIFERFVLSLFFGFIILDQIRGENSAIKFGKIKPFNYLGKISYGLYMYHLIVMYIFTQWISTIDMSELAVVPIYFGVSLSGTILISAISYQLIEKPLLKLKPK